MGPGNHVLDGGPDPPMGRGKFLRENGHPIVKYRDYEVGLSGHRQNADTADTLHLMDVAMATIFGFLYMGCTLAPPEEYD